MEPETAQTDDEFDVDSLFDSASPLESYFPELADPSRCSVERTTVNEEIAAISARRTSPPIGGLFFDPTILISEELEEKLISDTMDYFRLKGDSDSRADGKLININQAMLFGRASNGNSGLPPFLDELIVALAAVLQPHLPMETYEMLFPQDSTAANARSMSRQAILNHYFPGEGISPHVDLLRRFADGIIGVSLGSGTVMTFRRVIEIGESDRWDIYLPRRSIIVLSKEARYEWTHGIDSRSGDYVLDDGHEGGGQPTWITRKARISITLRWLLPGADIVGGE